MSCRSHDFILSIHSSGSEWQTTRQIGGPNGAPIILALSLSLMLSCSEGMQGSYLFPLLGDVGPRSSNRRIKSYTHHR